MPVVTNPVSLPSSYCMWDISFLPDFMYTYINFDTIGPTDFSTLLAPLFKTFQLIVLIPLLIIIIIVVRPCILIVVYVFLDAATLTEVFPCFSLGCKANARV
jgi:hypothetical protein